MEVEDPHYSLSTNPTREIHQEKVNDIVSSDAYSSPTSTPTDHIPDLQNVTIHTIQDGVTFSEFG